MFKIALMFENGKCVIGDPIIIKQYSKFGAFLHPLVFSITFFIRYLKAQSVHHYILEGREGTLLSREMSICYCFAHGLIYATSNH